MAEHIIHLGIYKVRVHTYPSHMHPDAPAAVVLPGMSANAHSLSSQIRLLRHLGYTPYVIELPGFGMAPALRKADARFPKLADMVAAVIHALGIEKCLLMGHSLGGGVALYLALRHPEMVEKLIVIAPAAAGNSIHWLYRLFCVPMLGRALTQPHRALGQGSHLRRALMGDKRRNDPHLTAMMARHASANSVYSVLSMRAIVWANQPPRLARIGRFFMPGGEQLAYTTRGRLAELAATPTLVMWDRQDRVFSSGDARFFRNALPNAKVHVEPNSGHMLPTEAPGWVNEHITRFATLDAGRKATLFALRSPAPASVPLVEQELDADTLQKRPWLKSYDAGVPKSLHYPDLLLDDMLSISAHKHPRSIATSFFGATLSYRDLDDLAARFASVLQGLRVKPGDRVALILPNCPQFPIAHFGALRAGAVVVPFNPTYTASEIRHQLEDSGAKIVVVLSKMYLELEQALSAQTTAVNHVIVTNIKEFMPPKLKALFSIAKEHKDGHRPHLAPGTLLFGPLLHAASPFSMPVLGRRNSDIALLQYTGGTTGVPKGAMLSHRALVANALQARAWDTGMTEGKDGVLALMPFFHVYGLTIGLHAGILGAAKLILIPKYELKDLLQTITRERPRLFPGAPRIYVALGAAKDLHKYDLSSIEVCMSGSAPLPDEVAKRFAEISGGKVVEGYGLTEAAPLTHANPFGGERRIGSIGIPVPDIDCKIVDLDTGLQELAVGEVGELCVKGPNLMDGYWGRPDETEIVIREGWLYTGDIARMDDQGYFQIVDRKKEMIIVNGLKVFPRDVDEVLYTHPAVLHAAVIGIPDATHGEVVKAFIVTKPGMTATEAEIKAHCATVLAKYKVPVAVEFRTELPMTVLGKILRRTLVEQEKAAHKQ